eukprot:scaffold138075_cov105-Phaeocystis_antarctica.AAC.1
MVSGTCCKSCERLDKKQVSAGFDATLMKGRVTKGTRSKSRGRQKLRLTAKTYGRITDGRTAYVAIACF